MEGEPRTQRLGRKPQIELIGFQDHGHAVMELRHQRVGFGCNHRAGAHRVGGVVRGRGMARPGVSMIPRDPAKAKGGRISA
jgi:hypothetical protein